MEQVRQAIVDKLTGLAVGEYEPLTASQFMPRTVGAFAAWPKWGSTEWANRCLLDIQWQVYVTLPAGDVATWTPVADALMQPVQEALEAIAHVSRCEPVTVAAGDGQGIPALQFTITIPAGAG